MTDVMTKILRGYADTQIALNGVLIHYFLELVLQ